MRDYSLIAILTTVLTVAMATPVAASGHDDGNGAPHRPWRLGVARDGFSGEIRCTLHSAAADIVVDHGGAGFRFSGHTNTLTAWYRVDGAAAARWQDQYPTLIANDVPVDGPSLRNPTGGIVWLPIDLVRNAQTVTIRPNDRSSPRTFLVAGLAAILRSAEQQGCAFDVARAD